MLEYSGIETKSLKELINYLVTSDPNLLMDQDINFFTADGFVGQQSCDDLEIISWYLASLHYPVETEEDDIETIVMLKILNDSGKEKYQVTQYQGTIRIEALP